ncbi:MAG: hypothetical protein ABEJ36_04010 [Candidatus Nanosalina sp.]
MKDKIFRLTPLGRADIELKKYLGAEDDLISTDEFRNYEEALQRYRNFKLLQMIVKIFLYAGLITSVAASLGLEELKIINRIASYLGFTIILIAYVGINYITMLHREEYHVKREILVSHTELKKETPGDEVET